MSRCDSYMGLNKWAENFVDGEVIKYTDYIERKYEDGTTKNFVQEGIVPVVKREKYDEFGGAFDSLPYALMKYVFPDNRVFYEYVQEVPWCSGPCFYIALRDEQGNTVPKSLWTDEEMYPEGVPEEGWNIEDEEDEI